MYQALEQEIQRLIETGVLHEGDALPGSRELAQKLGLSRKTVVTAMDRLTEGGLLERRNRVGLFVSGHSIPSAVALEEKEETVQSAEPKISTPRLIVDAGLPDITLMPAVELGRTYRQFFCCMTKWKQHEMPDLHGLYELRQAIAMAMCHSRSICAGVDDLMITSGTKQSVFLAAHALLHPGDTVVVEELINEDLARVYEIAGLRVVRVAVDSNGLRVDSLKDLLEQDNTIRAVHVTPRVNYPTTVPLSAERSQQLVQLVLDHNLLLVEDDYDGFFHMTRLPKSTLSSMLPKDNYVYACTSTRLLSPMVRIGFVVSSCSNISRMTDLKSMVEGTGDVVLERALMAMIDAGDIRRHIRRASKVYKERLDYISQLINRELQGQVRYKRPQSGLAIWLELSDDPTQRLQSKGIVVPTFALSNGRFGLRIGYASMSKEGMEQLVEALKE